MQITARIFVKSSLQIVKRQFRAEMKSTFMQIFIQGDDKRNSVLVELITVSFFKDTNALR